MFNHRKRKFLPRSMPCYHLSEGDDILHWGLERHLTSGADNEPRAIPPSRDYARDLDLRRSTFEKEPQVVDPDHYRRLAFQLGERGRKVYRREIMEVYRIRAHVQISIQIWLLRTVVGDDLQSMGME